MGWLLDGWAPWISSMASSCGGHHGQPMELHGVAPGWVGAMDIFHGKLMWRSPWAAHGIAWGGSWMGGRHGYLPWQAHVEVTMGSPWNCMGWLLDGWAPWISSMASSCGGHHGQPMELHGVAPGWVGAMDIFHGKLT